MHTPESTEDELDALFRQGAEHYPEEMNLGAWMRMEQKLDAEQMQRMVNRKVARLFVAELAVVAAVFLLWLVVRPAWQPEAEPAVAARVEVGSGLTKLSLDDARRPAPHKTQPPAFSTRLDGSSVNSGAKPATSTVPGSAGPNAAAREINQAAEPQYSAASAPTSSGAFGMVAVPLRRPKTSALPAEPAITSNGPNSEVKPTTAARSGNGVMPVAAATATQSAGVTGKAEPTSVPAEAQPDLAKPQAQGAAKVAGEPAVEHQSISEGNTSVARSEATGRSENGQQQPITAEPTTESAGEVTQSSLVVPADSINQQSAVATAAAAPADSAEQPRPKAPKPARRLLVGVYYAPEVSTVGRAERTDKLGSQFGIQLDYHLTARLRLTAGGFRTMKYYAARPSDYTLPSGTPTGYTIDHIDATCRITDIPVNLRYDAWQGRQSAAFVSAGLSSLLMRAEHYQYDYSYYGYPYSAGWSVFNGSNHWLSVVNLSAGYERQLGSRLSVQAEPFLKIPLGGVGAGKVLLRSGGLFFGLKYGL